MSRPWILSSVITATRLPLDLDIRTTPVSADNVRKVASQRLVALAALLACVQVSAAVTTLCGGEERVLFSCRLNNAKIVSLCSPKATDDHLAYRFGTQAKIELELTAAVAPSASIIFHKAEILYASNSAEIVWFKNSDYLYSIHLPARGKPGLEVARQGNVLAKYECDGGWGQTQWLPSLPSRLIKDHGAGDAMRLERLQGGQ